MTSNRSSHPEVFLRKGVFSGPHFPAFGLSSEYRKIRTRKISVFGHFPRSESFHVSYFCFCRSSRLEVFCRKGVLRNFAKFTGKHLRQSLLFNEVAGLLPSYRNQSTVLLCKSIDWFLYEGNSRSATLLKRRFWRRSFPVNFAKFLRLPFFYRKLPVAASLFGFSIKICTCNSTSRGWSISTELFYKAAMAV